MQIKALIHIGVTELPPFWHSTRTGAMAPVRAVSNYVSGGFKWGSGLESKEFLIYFLKYKLLR